MHRRCGQQMLRAGYQERQLPVTAARPATRMSDLRIGHYLSGTNGPSMLSHMRGRFEGWSESLGGFAHEDVRVIPWAGVLCVITVAVTSALVHADYKLPPLWALFGLALVAATAERFSIEVAG